MSGKQSKRQAGFALLIFLVVMMGLGGIALTGVTKGLLNQVEEKKFGHNERVLKEAKQALLQYAYGYPNIPPNTEGPGRLPCPDNNDDGLAETDLNCSNSGPIIGRLPFQQPGLSIGDIKDADGNRLWYAVSHTFSRNKGFPDRINSDSLGSISIYDTEGQVIHDGSSDAGGVVAVIIAPGVSIARTDGVNQVRIVKGDPDPSSHRTNPQNYLDIALGEDNADFAFGDRNSADGEAGSDPEGDDNGFVLGPVYAATTQELLSNDQFIVITQEEVTRVAELATLEAYRNAILEFQTQTGTYPWLDDYSLLTTATLNTNFDASVGIVHGRVPSIFTNYFTDQNLVLSELIASDLSLNISFVEDYLDDNIGTALSLPGARLGFDVAGNLVGDLSPAYSVTVVRYFWELPSVPSGLEDWKLCPGGGFNLSDCNRDIFGNPSPGSLTNDTPSKVREVTSVINLGASFLIGLDYPIPPLTQLTTFVAADSSDHAEILSTFSGDEISGVNIAVTFDQDDNYDATFDPTDPFDGQDDVDLLDANASVELGVRYYPVLPNWAINAENDWHNSIQFAYAEGYKPGVSLPASCNPGNPTPSLACLQLDNSPGVTNNKVALLSIGSAHNILDGDGDGFDDELAQIFEGSNSVIDSIFDLRPVNGDDKFLVVQ